MENDGGREWWGSGPRLGNEPTEWQGSVFDHCQDQTNQALAKDGHRAQPCRPTLPFLRRQGGVEEIEGTLGRLRLGLAADTHQPQRGHRDDQPQACRALRIGHAGRLPLPASALGQLEPALNGLITNDKFCVTRFGQLRLDWWRRPLRQRC